jgi:two-component system, OmpR family, response regulator
VREAAAVARIAIVEDDAAVRATVADLVRTEGFAPLALADAGSLFALLDGTEPPDLIVLDLRLPDRDGFAVAAAGEHDDGHVRDRPNGRGADIDRILGLEIGADDYVVKPFNARELLARIKAVLRRRGRETAGPSRPSVRAGYRFDGYLLDLDGRRLVDPAGEIVPLTVAEFDLLAALVKASGRVLSRDQLLELTHRAPEDVFDRTIDVLVLRLRRKIEPTPHSPRYIRTERGIGYVFDAEVTAVGVA